LAVSWHGNIVFLFGDKRISNPQTVLHLTPELTTAATDDTFSLIVNGMEDRKFAFDRLEHWFREITAS